MNRFLNLGKDNAVSNNRENNNNGNDKKEGGGPFKKIDTAPE
jgi:hypothetical protein